MDRPALVALAHGSRDPRSAATIRCLVQRVRPLRPGIRVQAAFLDLSEPGLGTVVDSLARAGVRDIVVVPLLLTEAYHARVDVPEAIGRAAAAHPGLRLRQTAVLGTDDALLDLLDRRLAGALRATAGLGDDVPALSQQPVDGLVLLSAGSSDAGANHQVADLARRWAARCGLPASAAYASAARPDAADAVRALHRAGASRVAAGSLFLAPGMLLDRAAERARGAGAVTVAEALGPDPLVARLVLDRFDAVLEVAA